MRGPLPLAVALLLPALLNAQALPDPALLRTRAKGMVDTLASPAFHGRGYVQNGSGVAADWIEARFRKIGLQPLKGSFTEPFTFDVNTFPDSVHMGVEGVVLRPGIAGNAELAGELRQHVKALLAPYKYPRRVVFTDALPKTQTGKIQRFRLRT